MGTQSAFDPLAGAGMAAEALARARAFIKETAFALRVPVRQGHGLGLGHGHGQRSRDYRVLVVPERLYSAYRERRCATHGGGSAPLRLLPPRAAPPPLFSLNPIFGCRRQLDSIEVDKKRLMMVTLRAKVLRDVGLCRKVHAWDEQVLAVVKPLDDGGDGGGDHPGEAWEGKVSHAVESLRKKVSQLEVKLESKMELMGARQEDSIKTLGDKLDELLVLQARRG